MQVCLCVDVFIYVYIQVGVVGGDCGELGPAAPWIINTLKGTYVPPRCGGTPTTDSPAKPVATDTGAGADATGSGTGAPLTPRCVVDKKYDIKSSSKGER